MPRMPSAPGSRTVDDSRVIMTEIVMPEDANHFGNVFGGRVLALIDKAGAVAAMRHCHSPVVTASIDRVDFHAGAKVGSILVLEAALNAVFTTSLEVEVVVWAEDPLTGERMMTCRAFVTMVCVNADGHPRPAPALLARGEDEARRAHDAAERRRHRKTVG
jgi:acyl-CoA hydrolase